MSEWSDKIERQNCDMEYIDKTYKDKWYVHRVIRFLRDNPERAPDYIDFVGDDWETRDLEDSLRKIEAVVEKWKTRNIDEQYHNTTESAYPFDDTKG